MTTLSENTWLWLPVALLAYSFVRIWIAAGIGHINQSAIGSVAWLPFGLAAIVCYYNINESGPTWQHWTLIVMTILGVGVNIMNIARGGKREDWNGSAAFFCTLIIAVEVWLLFGGIN